MIQNALKRISLVAIVLALTGAVVGYQLCYQEGAKPSCFWYNSTISTGLQRTEDRTHFCRREQWNYKSCLPWGNGYEMSNQDLYGYSCDAVNTDCY